MNFSNLANPIR